MPHGQERAPAQAWLGVAAGEGGRVTAVENGAALWLLFKGHMAMPNHDRARANE